MSAEPVRGAGTRRGRRPPGLDTPLESRRAVLPTPQVDPETFGRWSETFARYMGTARFIVGMTVFVTVWLAWNSLAPTRLQFDPRALNFTLLTLILSLQASYAAPLILLAQNRQADRDRVQFEQDRQRSERNLADTEYLAREVAALRIALRDVATRDFLRSELRDLLDELAEHREGAAGQPSGPAKQGRSTSKSGGKPSGKKGKVARPASEAEPASEPQPGSAPQPASERSSLGPTDATHPTGRTHRTSPDGSTGPAGSSDPAGPAAEGPTQSLTVREDNYGQ